MLLIIIILAILTIMIILTVIYSKELSERHIIYKNLIIDKFDLYINENWISTSDTGQDKQR